MFHYVYCVENIINGKVYVGKHSTENLDDGYMGSGKLLNQAIKKHGLENFRRHILKICETKEEAFDLERQIVDEEFIDNENTYNLIEGGEGGNWTSIGVSGSAKGGSKSLKNRWSDPEWRAQRIQETRERNQRFHAQGKMRAPDWTGRKHKEETKRAIGEANSVHQKGDKNSQFGTIWLHHLGQKVSKRVPREELEIWINAGWICGRKMRFV